MFPVLLLVAPDRDVGVCRRKVCSLSAGWLKKEEELGRFKAEVEASGLV